MGIKDLSKFIRDQCPEVMETIPLHSFAFKKIAIDTTLYMYTYKASHKGDWLSAFVNLVCVLRKNDIHCTFVYDGEAPVEKSGERAKRADQRNKLKDKVEKLEEALERYHVTSEVSPLLLAFQEEKNLITTSLLGRKNVFQVGLVQAEVQRLRDQLISITPADFQASRTLFDLLDIPYVTAPTEAEKFCADLCRRGEVDAVLSEDTDVLAYGAPIFLTKVNTREETFTMIPYQNVLDRFGFTPETFLDFCILCGTDYNSRIPKVGPVKAYTLLSNLSSIEEVEKSGLDTTILNYRRVRQLFTEFPEAPFKMRYCGTPNYQELAVFFKVKHIRLEVETLKKCFERNVHF